MRKIYLILGLFCCSILFLSNSAEQNFIHSFFLMGDQGDPVLPDIPYEYGNIELPDHLETTPYGQNETTFAEPVSDTKATLGRVLFYDEKLSANENLSCATCHQQHLSFADDTEFSAGVSEDTERNSMQLNDLGWSNNTGFFWDMSEGNLDDMIALPLENVNEIGVTDLAKLIEKLEETTYYPALFEDAYGNSEINLEKIQSALGDFIRSMVTFDTRFDRVQRGDKMFTAQELEGFFLFRTNCEECHSDGNHFSLQSIPHPSNVLVSKQFLFNELEGEDKGIGEWNGGMDGHFKSPTLRNIEVTAPYMHDGRFGNIREVIDHYSDEIGTSKWGIIPTGGYQFTEDQKDALQAFLHTLTDHDFLTNVKWSDPFERTSTNLGEVTVVEAKVFPNPSNSLTYVTFDNPSQTRINAFLMNIEGKIIRKFTTHSNGFATDVSQLPAGMYVVRIENGNGFIDKKLMVQ